MACGLWELLPWPGMMAYDEKDKKTAWRPQIPAWAGSIDSDSYYDAYEKGCEELGPADQGNRGHVAGFE